MRIFGTCEAPQKTTYCNILSEEVLHAGEYILIVAIVRTLEIRLLTQLLNQLALLLGQLGGYNDIDNDDYIATTATINIGETLTTEAKHLARLCARLDRDTHATVDCRHLGIATKDSGSHRNTEVVDKIVATTLEVGMILLLDYYDEVAIYATMARSITHTLKRESHALRYARGNLNLYNLIAALCTLATTVGTLILDDATLALTCGADALCLHATKEGVLHSDNIARTTTLRAGGIRRLILCSRATAVLTRNNLIEFELLGHALGRSKSVV